MSEHEGRGAIAHRMDCKLEDLAGLVVAPHVMVTERDGKVIIRAKYKADTKAIVCERFWDTYKRAYQILNKQLLSL